jgi:hypothetical protein
MRIAFFTEMGFEGKVPRNHPNMRTEFAWMCALNADHYSIIRAPFVTEQYDLGIVIIPKKNPDFDINSLKILNPKSHIIGDFESIVGLINSKNFIKFD